MKIEPPLYPCFWNRLIDSYKSSIAFKQIDKGDKLSSLSSLSLLSLLSLLFVSWLL